MIEHSRERLSLGSDVVVLITLQSETAEPALKWSAAAAYITKWLQREKDHGNQRPLTVIDQQSSRMADNKEEEVAVVGKEVSSDLVGRDATCNAIIDRDDCQLKCTLQLVDGKLP